MSSKYGLCTAVVAAGITCAAVAQQRSEQVWQFDDGRVVTGERTFRSLPHYHEWLRANDAFPKCSTSFLERDPNGGAGGIAGGGPSDCSMQSTNPSDDYDPSVVTYRIPVVVHVIRNSSGSQGDISQSMVESGIRILNEDVNAFADSNGANGNDARIEFFLAEADPSGNPTNGITYSNNTSWFNDSGGYYNTLAWDPHRFLNIYTNSAGGSLGYVPFLPQEGSPGAPQDRVVVYWETFGENGPYGPPYDQGRTLTHEVGHFLGLYHTFDGCGGSCSTAGDRICDTTTQSQPTYGCSSANSCGTPDNIDNYMDYSDDLCMEQFTPHQVRRMRCTLEHYRPLLYSTGDGGGGGGNGCSSACGGDINADGAVNGGDLGLMVAAWGACGESECCADLNQDGVVNGGDLGSLLGAWGDCPGDPCEDVNCDDGDPCTIDTCTNGECSYEQIPDCGGGDEGCGDPDSGSCSSANGTPYCDDEACCTAVCAVDPYCCEEEWDALCADAVPAICNGGGGGKTLECGDPRAGSCSSANGTPFCSDEACCEAICAVDPYCCNTEWDDLCVDATSSEGACNS